ncbi:phage major capsid protein [Enterococcus sp. DIV0086]|uniref:phage major capsid protein n=1 Tax=Enterococcus sp. DIV0086 TaxID=2774655 RepID=UPI003D2C4806
MATIEQMIGKKRAREFRTASKVNSFQQNSKKLTDIKRKQVLQKIKRAMDTEKQPKRKNTKKKVRKMNQEKQSLRGLANYLTGNLSIDEVRSLGVVVNNGKVLLTKKLSQQIISYAQENNPVRKLGQVYRQKGKKGISMLVQKAEANIVLTERDETNQTPETDTSVEVVWLEPIEIDGMAKFTHKLENMSDFDIEKILVEELGKAIVRKEVDWFIHSSDNSYSLNSKGITFVPATLTGSLYKYLVEAKNALPTPMRKKATWLINRAAQTQVESLLDESGNPIFKESGNNDFAFKLFNYPVEVTDQIDEKDPAVPVMYFGDFSYFHIQDVLETIEVERLNELFTKENKIGVSVYEITDGKLIFGPFETAMFKLNTKQFL